MADRFFHLSMLIAHKLSILAVHSKTSSEIQISHSIQPRVHVPKQKHKEKELVTFIEFNQSLTSKVTKSYRPKKRKQPEASQKFQQASRQRLSSSQNNL